MPVIGHTFAGILIGQEFEPAGRRNPRPLGPTARALWLPALVGLSYLPDVVTQVALWMGYQSAQSAGHSIPLGLVAGVLLGLLWARMTGASPRLLIALAAGAIVLHDVLDLLQDAERMPFWPLSMRRMGVAWLPSSDRLWGEIVVFGVPFALYEVWRAVRRRRTPAPVQPAQAVSLIWLGRGLVLAVVLSALVVLQLRVERQRQMNRAQDLVRARKFGEALTAIDLADRWPASSSVSGDLLRARVYAALGDTVREEALLLKAYQASPDDFWAVASLAEYYASHGTGADRMRRSAPYVDELQRHFPTYAALSRVMERIKRDVSKGA